MWIVSIALWTLPLLAGTIFVALFAVANPIVEEWLHRSFNEVWAFIDWLSFLSPLRVGMWGIVAAGTYGILRHRRLRLKRVVHRAPIAAAQRSANWLTGQGMIIRCLLVFNSIFAVESALDTIYLLGGARLPEGMTYASYAHRGAYPLIFTAILAGAFVMIAFRTGGSGHRSMWARRLVYVWIVQNIILLFSTCLRLKLYVEAYSLDTASPGHRDLGGSARRFGISVDRAADRAEPAERLAMEGQRVVARSGPVCVRVYKFGWTDRPIQCGALPGSERHWTAD